MLKFFNLNKGISTPIGILIIVLVAIIAGAGILAWQYFGAQKEIEISEEKTTEAEKFKRQTEEQEKNTEAEIADWKIYRNEEYGFKIKYPKNWSARKYSEKSVGFSPLRKEHLEIRIEVELNTDFYKWIEEKINVGIYRNKKEITIGFEDYQAIEVQDLGIVNFRNILLSRGSIVYRIFINEDSSEMSTFNQMLSSFRFITEHEEITESEIADWKIYIWDWYADRYEFKYPPNWEVQEMLYLTPAQQAEGETPSVIGLSLFLVTEPITTRNSVSIYFGGRQEECGKPNAQYSKCVTFHDVPTYTYSKRSDTLEIFDDMVTTLKYEKIE